MLRFADEIRVYRESAAASLREVHGDKFNNGQIDHLADLATKVYVLFHGHELPAATSREDGERFVSAAFYSARDGSLRKSDTTRMPPIADPYAALAEAGLMTIDEAFAKRGW
jgi:hypothetical protein